MRGLLDESSIRCQASSFAGSDHADAEDRTRQQQRQDDVPGWVSLDGDGNGNGLIRLDTHTLVFT